MLVGVERDRPALSLLDVLRDFELPLRDDDVAELPSETTEIPDQRQLLPNRLPSRTVLKADCWHSVVVALGEGRYRRIEAHKALIELEQEADFVPDVFG